MPLLTRHNVVAITGKKYFLSICNSCFIVSLEIVLQILSNKSRALIKRHFCLAAVLFFAMFAIWLLVTVIVCYRIKECLRLEGTSGGHLVQLSFSSRVT